MIDREAADDTPAGDAGILVPCPGTQVDREVPELPLTSTTREDGSVPPRAQSLRSFIIDSAVDPDAIRSRARTVPVTTVLERVRAVRDARDEQQFVHMLARVTGLTFDQPSDPVGLASDSQRASQ